MTSLGLLPAEDRDVLPNEWLLRYIHWRQTTDSGDLTTAAFRDSDGTSVDRERLLPNGRTRAGYEHPFVGTTKFQAKDCINGDVIADPTPDNISHALIVVPDNKRALKDKMAEHLKKLVRADWDPAACLPRRQAAERRAGELKAPGH